MQDARGAAAVKPAPFAYHAVHELDEALVLLAEHGEDAAVIAGGQSLVPLLALRMARFDHLVDINGIAALAGIEHSPAGLAIGAVTRQAAVERAQAVHAFAPLLAQATHYVGHFQIRNRGTVGGSLAFADPAGEYPAAALALEAEVDVASVRGTRTIPVDQLLESAWTTTLAPDELLTGVRITDWGPRSGYAVREIARRHGDFALVGAMAAITVDHADKITRANVVAFGTAPRASKLDDATACLVGRAPNELDLDMIAREGTAKLRPPTDALASAEYRRRAAVPLVADVIRQAIGRALASARPEGESA